eukprot:gene9972-12226_t
MIRSFFTRSAIRRFPLRSLSFTAKESYFPYGVSSWATIKEDEKFYVDKTKAIEELESVGEHLKLFRPRRFGKSLFCDQLALYYDVLESGSKESFHHYINFMVRDFSERYYESGHLKKPID